MKGTAVGTAVRACRVVVAVVCLSVAQDVVSTIVAHGQYASASVCSNDTLRAEAGRYGDVHCREHTELASFWALSSYLAAIAELKWQRLASVAAGVMWAV